MPGPAEPSPWTPRFSLTDAPVDDALLNQHHPSFEVDVLPTKSQHFDTRIPVHIATITIVRCGSCSMDNQLLKLLRGEYLRFLVALACPL